MLNRKAIGIIAATILGLVLPATALALGLRGGGRTHAARAVPTSKTTSGVRQIGTLYATAATTEHECTASVVASPHGNTLITAAHCISGNGAGMVFIPGQTGSQAPYGRWTVTAAHVADEWVTRQDPDDDVAFLTVAPRTVNGRATEIQQITGAYHLGSTARRGQKVTVTGYPAGTTDDAITCSAQTYLTEEYPSFDCHGYVSGTSGSPWVRPTAHGPEIVGVIGGLRQGGCYEYTSYSAPLARSTRAYERASADTSTDVAPAPGGDGC